MLAAASWKGRKVNISLNQRGMRRCHLVTLQSEDTRSSVIQEVVDHDVDCLV